MPRSTASARLDPRLERLLELYSLQKLNYRFEPKEKTKQAIIKEILESSSVEELEEFAFLQHSTTKHHVQLFEHSRCELAALPRDPLDLPRLVRTEQSSKERIWFYLIELSYEVFLRDPVEMTTMEFLWPVRIRCSPTILELDFTIMEKNLSSRFPEGRAVRAIRTIDEKVITRGVRDSLALEDGQVADLNRGIKSLWEGDMIDSVSVGWKKARSVSRETMDEDRLLRREEPELFQTLLDKPLLSAVFRWIGGGNVSVDHFAADATQGALTFRTFSDLGTGADYVVREIIKRN